MGLVAARLARRILPEVDVEGAALHRKVHYENWAAGPTPTAVYASALGRPRGAGPVDVVAPLGAVTRMVAPEGADERTLANVLVGRSPRRPASSSSTACCCPSSASRSIGVASVVDLAGTVTEAELEQHIRATARLSSGSRRAQREQLDRTVALVGELDAAIGPGSPHTMRSALVDAAQAVASGVRTVVITGLDELLLAQDRHRTERLADALAGRGLGVVLLLTHADESATPAEPPGSLRDEPQEKRVVHD